MLRNFWLSRKGPRFYSVSLREVHVRSDTTLREEWNTVRCDVMRDCEIVQPIELEGTSELYYR